jgi:hypothetical protein
LATWAIHAVSGFCARAATVSASEAPPVWISAVTPLAAVMVMPPPAVSAA